MGRCSLFDLERHFAFYGAYHSNPTNKAGSLAALLLLFCWVASSFLGCWLGFSLAWKVVVVAQIVCWTGQFIGHGVFETLQTFFGYEPYPGFHATVQAKVDTEIREWQEKKQKLLN
ncbi:unnamed protein product [Linum tenue]|uniref:Uncharacterized protein n=1 Tax=Linum tenue TaxID=586396 RepID=A0AAV0IZM5_9ROSI|nr:unnamed protein product [Linum tenue]